MPRSRLTPVLSGVAGEYFVAAELSRRGYVASVTLRNTRGIDILASNANATRSVGIQVKTRQDAGRTWVLTKKAEDAPRRGTESNLFYVFVSLNGRGAPSFHIVPRAVVARHVRVNYRRWLRTPGRHGRKHVETLMRQFADPFQPIPRCLGVARTLTLRLYNEALLLAAPTAEAACSLRSLAATMNGAPQQNAERYGD